MTIDPPRCLDCDHFRGSHIGPPATTCIVERISGPASGADTAPSPGDPHPGRIVDRCGCRFFILRRG
jgi:hypothetical protein